MNAALARASCYNLIGEFDMAIQDYEAGLLLDMRNNLKEVRRKTNLSTRLTSGSRSERSRHPLEDKENRSLSEGLVPNNATNKIVS